MYHRWAALALALARRTADVRLILVGGGPCESLAPGASRRCTRESVMHETLHLRLGLRFGLGLHHDVAGFGGSAGDRRINAG